MARTHLFSKMASALRTARLLERRGAPEEIDVPRRRFLQALGLSVGAAALGTALPACANDEAAAPPETDTQTASISGGKSSSKSPRVIVIGAGLAGLVAAYRLSQQGRRVRVYDANNRVGGRTFTLRDHFATKVELGGELIDTGHVVMQGLVRELGLTLLDLAEATAPLERERYFLDGEAFSESEIVTLFRPIARQLDADYAAQGPDIASYDAHNEVQRRLDRLSIHQWFELHAFRGPARALIELAYVSEYGRETSEQSYLNLLYLISTDAPPFELYGESDERFTVKEGNDAIAQGLSARLPEPVVLEHRLEAVRGRSDGRVELVLDSRGRRVEEVADQVVLALPFTQLRKCDITGLPVSAAQRRAIDGLGYGTNSKLMIGMASRPWVAHGASGTSFTDAVYQESWDSSRGYPTPGAAMTSFTGGTLGLSIGEGSAVEQGARFIAQLDRVFPGARAAWDGRAVRMVWATARHFEGSYACYAPGDWTGFSGAEKRSFGNVHVAGEHTSTDFQGFMEGAAASGERAAAEILG